MSRLFKASFLVWLGASSFLWADNTSSDYLQSLLQKARLQHVAEERYWRLLLHEDRTIWKGRYFSVAGSDFYLSSQRPIHPEEELDATLRAFFTPPSTDPEKQHPQCRFPERYAWLKEKLGFDGRLPEQPCPRFETWKSHLDAHAVTLVFASYYLNNPASMYGHTFLRLVRKPLHVEDPLLDYTVNFAAEADPRNGLAFAFWGLTGGYGGTFSTMPYYMKVQTYNNLESRDLWEYPLTLDQAAVDRLVRHLWELGGTAIPYYFFNKNCSYQLLPVLEIADPRLHLREHFWVRTVPSDTLRVLMAQPGKVSGYHLRSSHVSQMLARRALLSRAEVQCAQRVGIPRALPGQNCLNSLTPDRQALVLDSAHDYFRYRVGFARDQSPVVEDQEQQLLLQRSRLATPSPGDFNPMSPNGGVTSVPPQEGHPTGRLTFGSGWTKHTRFQELEIRPGLHDLEESPRGYVPGSQLEMFKLRLRWDDQRKTVNVREMTLAHIVSLSPWDPWIRKPSWTVATGFDNALDLGKDPENSLYYGLRAGSGLSWKFDPIPGSLVYAFAQADSGLGRVFRDYYRFGGGGTVGIVLPITSWSRTTFQADLWYYPLGNVGESDRLQAAQAFDLTSHWQLRVVAQRQNQYKEVLLNLNRYW